ncbi:MAG: iron uptake porin, partial [Coleofasciculaceae cyanobacterium]
MKNLQQLLYTSFLLTGVLAVPVAAQTVNTETRSASTTATQISNELDQASIVPLFTLPESAQTRESLTATSQKVAEVPSESELPKTPLLQLEVANPTPSDKTTSITQISETLPTENNNESQTETDSMDQVTNVSQLRDVAPSDWAYEALRSLVERYGCIAGYPDGTFRGNRAMSRFEFAAGLNACLQQIEKLVAGAGSDFATRSDLETLQRLVSEFRPELTTIGKRVDTLESRTTRLEERQFSTTTKLFGQAIVGIQGRSENSFDFFPPNRLQDNGTNINLVNSLQLSLLTQFSPRSLLVTGLAAGNGNNNSTRLAEYTSLGYETGTNNNLEISDLNYRQLFGSKFALIVGPVAVNPVNVFRGVNRIESAGSG